MASHSTTSTTTHDCKMEGHMPRQSLRERIVRSSGLVCIRRADVEAQRERAESSRSSRWSHTAERASSERSTTTTVLVIAPASEVITTVTGVRHVFAMLSIVVAFSLLGPVCFAYAGIHVFILKRPRRYSQSTVAPVQQE
ncbi:hypothetical protein CYLTODRAFT_425862 [Cylindrobasidium torrendii FP15055 ss-10]|uniref:Uncharacterized protein n=1 Tax=Cylindrobasidium torrendii FP15055 ss-10 TaxID=1314674 RepID=A0A0D7AZS6_9AGAR|nr:hypothetical protein CYLTODRAFT_425862 [Cylindrobasidium torrendii FP15055 ss-10]